MIAQSDVRRTSGVAGAGTAAGAGVDEGRRMRVRRAPRTVDAARTGRASRSAARRLPAVIALAATAVLALSSCVGASGASDLAAGAPSATPTPTASAPAATTPPADPSCDAAPTASYAPTGANPAPGAMPSGSYMAEIAERNLVVGVSADTLLMGSRNPLTGSIEGFDIDVLHEISNAIFGDPNRLQFKVITSAQRLAVLQTPVEQGGVDIVARTMTINCARWASIDFSSTYYEAGQKVLVASNNPATSISDLGGQKVCAPDSTTTLANLTEDYPDVDAVAAATHTGCLVLFQQGEVDAITGDDTILAGFAAQDPYAKVIGTAFTSEPYGLGINKEHTDFVRFVNAELETMRTDGTWASIYDKWLDVLGPAPTPPAAVYGR